ncbi:hypothetical protein SAZ10_00435 [Mesorhizobium sp. BAC0120]|uniref:hypothetical protein n=1 Tax=Mesorhizobium sp. BAC0120 TaxID=3090670 RepID=UPI00298C82CD|nr:hypothetical protein [Mesorhizobium sp. BAC0120]MDW6020222.1 hypothetical protein [Mesorhizobium sp. BAC0120]
MSKVVANRSSGLVELNLFDEGVSGHLPNAGSGVILAAADDVYYRQFAGTFLGSLERQEQPQQVHLHLYRPSLETLQHIEGLASRFRYISLTWTVDRSPLSDRLRYRSVYYTCARFLIATRILHMARVPVLCLDVDSIAVRPVWPVYEPAIGQGDVALIRRQEERSPLRKVLISAAGLNPTADGLRFASNFSRALASILAIRPNHHIDQIVAHYLIEAMPGLKIAGMPRQLADYDFSENGALWTAKGWRLKKSNVYLEAKRQVDEVFEMAS